MKRHRKKKHYADRQHRPVITYPAQKEGPPDLQTRRRRNQERRARASFSWREARLAQARLRRLIESQLKKRHDATTSIQV